MFLRTKKSQKAFLNYLTLNKSILLKYQNEAVEKIQPRLTLSFSLSIPTILQFEFESRHFQFPH